MIDGYLPVLIPESNTSIQQYVEVVNQRCPAKKMFLEISQNSQGNTCAKVSFLKKVAGLACNFIKKETLAQVFSCEYCEFSKYTFSHKTAPVADSEYNILK